jgi:hypothetical protein
MATVSFDTATVSGPSEEEPGCKEFVRDVLNCASVIEGV